ncbi:MAG: hypothetical protein JKY55_08405 [Aliivibrio sp.]|uniref:hypothetical protein n=1 Tax=Aliivibrio sp. TaxID=1872443 RepID=UPI001A3EA9F7|nr:hypothetical protein [Aliivibrio sp.]
MRTINVIVSILFLFSSAITTAQEMSEYQITLNKALSFKENGGATAAWETLTPLMKNKANIEARYYYAVTNFRRGFKEGGELQQSKQLMKELATEGYPYALAPTNLNDEELCALPRYSKACNITPIWEVRRQAYFDWPHKAQDPQMYFLQWQKFRTELINKHQAERLSDPNLWADIGPLLMEGAEKGCAPCIATTYEYLTENKDVKERAKQIKHYQALAYQAARQCNFGYKYYESYRIFKSMKFPWEKIDDGIVERACLSTGNRNKIISLALKNIGDKNAEIFGVKIPNRTKGVAFYILFSDENALEDLSIIDSFLGANGDATNGDPLSAKEQKELYIRSKKAANQYKKQLPPWGLRTYADPTEGLQRVK